MSEENKNDSPIKRILAALDASASSLNAMDTAVELAARFGAELRGIFVEDVKLLRLAQLPFAREISFYSPQLRKFGPGDMELQLRVQAIRIRDMLARRAEQLGVPWEFRTARGNVGAEVLSAGAEADLVVMGKIGRSLPGLRRSGSTTRTLLTQRGGMTLITETTLQLVRNPVLGVYNGSESAEKTLFMAAYLARIQEVSLIVLVVAGDAERAAENQRTAAEQLKKLGVQAEFRRLVSPALNHLAERIRRETAGTVVIPCLEDWFQGEKLCGLIDEIANPVLLIR